MDRATIVPLRAKAYVFTKSARRVQLRD